MLNLGSDVTQIHRVGSLAYMSPEQLDGGTLDCRADIYSLGAVLYHLIAGRPLFDAQVQSAMMHQIYNVKPASLVGVRAGVTPGARRRDPEGARQAAGRSLQRLGASSRRRSRALVTTQQVPRGQFQGVLDSERFTLLRTLEFFANFGDVELWEVVHRAKWQRFHFGHALYRKGEEGNSFHIMAQGEVEVFRDGKKVAQLGAGTSVGEMAYLAPSAELKKHSTDVIVTEPATTISFTPETLLQLSPNTPPPVPRLLHQGAGAAAALGARSARAPAPHLLAAVDAAWRRAVVRASSPRQRRRVLQSPDCRAPRVASPHSETFMKQLITLAAPGAGGLDLGLRQHPQGSARMAGERADGGRRHEHATQGVEKKLAGAAKTSFVKKCEADAATCLRRQGGREEARRRGEDQLVEVRADAGARWRRATPRRPRRSWPARPRRASPRSAWLTPRPHRPAVNPPACLASG